MEIKIIIYIAVVLIISRILVSQLELMNLMCLDDKRFLVSTINTCWTLLFLYLLFKWVIIPITIWWFTN